jgi:hypothetical protein
MRGDSRDSDRGGTLPIRTGRSDPSGCDLPRWARTATYHCCGYRVTGTLRWPPRCRYCGREMAGLG